MRAGPHLSHGQGMLWSGLQKVCNNYFCIPFQIFYILNSYQCILGAFHIERVSDGWNGVGNKHD